MMLRRLLMACVAIFAILLFSQPVVAKIKLPSIFGDNMVLQQNKCVALWGSATANSVVTVKPSWGDSAYRTMSNERGEWQVNLQTISAGGPYAIYINDGCELMLNNIMLGEVWICSGQSNMSMPMRGYYGQYIEGADKVIATASQNHNIRLFNVKENISKSVVSECDGIWEVSSPATVSEFSAAAYYFGINLSAVMPDVPIGLLCCSVGGSTIEAWIDEQTLRNMDNIDKSITYGYKPAHKQASVLYNGMIAPINRYAARGFIWYQGEANTDNYFDYARLMQSMVECWRRDWNDVSMPFYYVQLVQWHYGNKDDDELPLTVAAQYDALKLISTSGIVPTTDLSYNLAIHPPHKDIVGFRLAQLALAQTYGIKGIQCSYPRFRSANIVDDRIVVAFDGVPYGLKLEESIVGFEVASDDGVFHPVDALVGANGDNIEIKFDASQRPRYIQYAFRNYMKSNLLNTIGLPLAPFRSEINN